MQHNRATTGLNSNLYLQPLRAQATFFWMLMSCLALFGIAASARAQEDPSNSEAEHGEVTDDQVIVHGGPMESEQIPIDPAYANPAFALPKDPNRQRNDIWPPLMSLFFPGFDQWWEGQDSSALAYSGIAAGGLMLSYEGASRLSAEERADKVKIMDPLDNRRRMMLFGAQTYQAMGGFSAYHSFRSAVRTRQAHGRYAFLHREESWGDLMLSPFDFRYLERTTTLGALGACVGLNLLIGALSDPATRRQLNGSDALYAGGISFNAGTHEEAVFRGWLMPLFYDRLDNFALANGLNATIFALAHRSTVEVPLPQLLLGGYLGYVTRERGWTIGEAIFIHTWWDVISLLQALRYAGGDPSAPKAVRLTFPILEQSL